MLPSALRATVCGIAPIGPDCSILSGLIDIPFVGDRTKYMLAYSMQAVKPVRLWGK
jgi:hypothetical protein